MPFQIISFLFLVNCSLAAQCTSGPGYIKAAQYGSNALIINNSGNTVLAKNYARRAINGFKEIQCWNGLCESYIALAKIHLQKLEFPQTRELIDTINQLFEVYPIAEELKAEVLFLEGMYQIDQGRYHQGIKILKNLRLIFSEQERNNVNDFKEIYHSHALRYNTDERIKIFYSISKGYISNGIGIAYQRMRAYKQSEVFYREACSFFEESGQWNPIAQGYSNLGLVLMESSQTVAGIENARSYLMVARDSLKKHEFKLLTKTLLGHLNRLIASSYNRIQLKTRDEDLTPVIRAYYDEAIEYFTNSFSLIEPLFSEPAQALTAATYAEYANFLANRDPDTANLFFEIADSIAQNENRISTDMLVNIYYYLGLTLKQLNEKERAVKYFKTTLFLKNKKLDREVLNEDVNILLLESRSAMAANEIGLIYELEETNDETQKIRNLEEALEYYEVALEYLDKKRAELSYVEGLGIPFQSSIEAINDSHFNFFTNAVRAANKLSGLYSSNSVKQQNLNAKIFTFFEKSKAYLLRLQIDQNDFLASLTDREKNSLRDFQAKVFEAEQQIRIAETKKSHPNLFSSFGQLEELNDVLLKAKENLINYFDQIPQTKNLVFSQTIDLSTAQNNLLSDSSAILTYLYDELDLFTLLVKKNEVVIKKLPLPGDFEKLIIQFDTLAYSQHLYVLSLAFDYARVSARLYSILFEPVKDKLDHIKQLVISRHHRLNYINFDLLLTKRFTTLEEVPVNPINKSPNFLKFPFLIHEFAFSYTHSASTLVLNKKKKTDDRNKLHYGGFEPSYQIRTLKDLKQYSNAKNILTTLNRIEHFKEVETVEKEFPLDVIKVFKEKAANEAAFRSLCSEYSFDILHISAHSFLDSISSKSFIAFTHTGQSEDDLLTLGELSTMEINSALLILTTCYSGTSFELNRTEGLISLARSFMQSGCSNIIMGVKLVEKKVAELIIHNFIIQLQKQVPVDIALQQSKLHYLRSGISDILPRRWASLVPMGYSFEPID